MNQLLIPVAAFFSRPFYQSVSRDASNKGFLYLLYLGALFTVSVLLMSLFVLQPQMNQAVEWIKKEMPVLTLNQEGLSMNQPSPYTMDYPDFGPVMTFDMTKDSVTPGEMGEIPAFVTRSNFYIQSNRRTQVYPLKTSQTQNSSLAKNPVMITPETVDQFYASMKPIFLATMAAGSFIFLYFWKLCAALFYSLPALAFNSMRVQKLSYGKVLDLTIYALTPATIFQMLRMLVPGLNQIPFLFVLDISITLAYVYFAVKMSEDSPAAA